MVEEFSRGKFSEIDKSSMIHQLQAKPYKLVLTINDLWLLYSFTKHFVPKSQKK